MARLVTVLQTLAGAPALTVYTGVPASLAGRVNAYVTLDRWELVNASLGQVEHRIDFGVTFAYRVGADTETTEVTMASRVGAFQTAMRAERLSRLNGTASSVALPDYTRAADPQYVSVIGTEFRIYPGTVRTTHYEQD